MKRIVSSILFVMLMSVTALTLTGCDMLDQLFPVNPPYGENGGDSGEIETGDPSEDERQTFVFTELEDGTYSVASTDYDSLPADLVIPSEYEGKPVTVIADYGFNGAKITSLTIPDSVHTIGVCAFASCENLVELNMGNSVVTIDRAAFLWCRKLSELVFSNKLEAIKVGAFEECESITEVIIPDSVVLIDAQAFIRCPSITHIKIGAGVQTIEFGAFAFSCKSLESIEVSESNEYYRSEGNCLILKGFEQVILGCNSSVIPENVAGIYYAAFNGCEELSEIKIPKNVISIYSGAFANCKNLESIIVDKDNVWFRSENNCLISNENNVILGCKNSILPDDVVSIGDSAFFGCQDLLSIVIPESVTSIGDAAFYNCDGLTSIVIPDSVTSIGDSAFRNCDNLENVVIGKGVQTIGNTVFYESPKVTDIYYTGTEQEWKKIVIKNDMIDNNVLLNATKHYNYVPEK